SITCSSPVSGSVTKHTAAYVPGARSIAYQAVTPADWSPVPKASTMSSKESPSSVGEATGTSPASLSICASARISSTVVPGGTPITARKWGCSPAFASSITWGPAAIGPLIPNANSDISMVTSATGVGRSAGRPPVTTTGTGGWGAPGYSAQKTHSPAVSSTTA